ncbi:hypothetical protein [Petrachloros mirabilis]
MEITLKLQPPHQGQLDLWRGRERFNAVRCGRRWGKTQFAVSLCAQSATNKQSWGIFAPDYKILSETYRELETILRPVTESSSKTDGLIRLITGGRIDFWTLNNPRAGRSRKYHGVILDEVAFAGPDMTDLWQKAIAPTLLDYKGQAWALSTPNGLDPENWFCRICTEPELGWKQFHAPTSSNPFLDSDAVAKLQSEYPPLVYQQEYLAEFVDWSGSAFFSEDALLHDGKPVEYPKRCDTVFAIIDTAVKDTLEHDGTAVIYCAKDRHAIDHHLTILDWDVLQIEGYLLETWLPGVYMRLDELTAQTGARYGSSGTFIEDKSTGSVLIQHARNRGMQVEAIDSTLTALGKDPRAISASPYVYRGDVKISQHAYDKVKNYRGQTRNHLLSQVCGYRPGTKTPHGMDLLDAFTYSVMLGLGDSAGY